MTDILALGAGWPGSLLEALAAPGRLLLPVIGVILALVGLILIHRISDPGSLARGEARWRYRARDRIGGLNRGAASVHLPPRTRGWWITRIEFGTAIGMIVGLPLLLLAQPTPMGGGAYLTTELVLPSLAGYAGMLFGLWWMLRIYRAGLRNDAEATWRYRDRQS